MIYLYDAGDGCFGYALNLDWPDGSEWGYAPFGPQPAETRGPGGDLRGRPMFPRRVLALVEVVVAPQPHAGLHAGPARTRLAVGARRAGLARDTG